MDDRVRVISSEVLSDAWGVLKSTVFDYRRLDGNWERQTRETYDRGNGAAVLPYDPARNTVLLVRQFRFPAYLQGHPEPLLEACAGLLDEDDPETCARREAQEELGYQLHDLELICVPFMTPGSVTERLACFVARYSQEDRVSAGGGHIHEGEDIEVVEMTLEEAYRATRDGRISDAKTIVLIQHLVIDQARGE
ncbi:NUDIX domain-containing protein [Pseudaminobacter sp. 19-2017]|uniref:GDP-mannose pyrophosphatase n=1 Tax=Pseudaminobacter soli (ex Zhang et al. 2022) TaxID=2831468 RepID=A0A942DY34_9HYPH|nr:NUDIX domain-containing protein [Pseudaminobacter soli]MBS3647095.1 NUDIX domain-containing protein [Pseudaminobacter soli]